MSENRKAAIITGAASGIGAATARRFAAEGWLVGLFDVDIEKAEALAHELGETRAIAFEVDVADPARWEPAVAAFGKAAGGRLDLLFNNAGILAVGHFEDIPVAQTQRLIAVNLGGAINGIYACLPLLKATRGARIINNSSLTACYGSPAGAAYGASKAALRNLSQALSIEFADHGILVIYVMPGFVRTGMFDEGQSKQQASLRHSLISAGVAFRAPERVAAIVWKAAHRRRLHWTVGRQTVVHAAIALYFPWLARRLLRLQTRLFWKEIDE